MSSQKELEKQESGRSMSNSLSKELATHLFKVMKDVTERDTSAAAVNAACNCAKQIHNILRLEFEAKKYLGK